MADSELPFDLETLPKTLSFRSGCVESENRTYLIVQFDALADLGEPDSYVFEWNKAIGEWVTHFNVDWLATKICGLDNGELLLMGTMGQVAVRRPDGAIVVEHVDPGLTGPKGSGPLRDLRIIGGTPVVCGMARRVYARRSPGSWVPIDAGMALIPSEEVVVGFNSIDGLDENHMVAVGFAGEIWLRDAALGWTQAASPTNVVLHRIKALQSGYFYASGQLGTILYGRGENWRVIEHELTSENLWGLEYFAGEMYTASESAIFRINSDNSLERVDTAGLGEDWTYRHLYANAGVLWSFGPRHVAWTSDAKTWNPATP
jgi:hypothetical protein